MLLISAGACLLICGCASNKSHAKKTYERPWIGGVFQTAAAPLNVRTNSERFGKQGALLVRVHTNSPASNAGLQEGDLALALNGKAVRSERDINKILDDAGPSPVRFTIYRDGLSQKQCTPGRERFQKINTISVGVKVDAHFVIDLFPSPDFSLIALGYEHKDKRLDLSDPKAKYRKQLAEKENTSFDQSSWEGLRSNEGWIAWLGPLSLSQNKMILSQELR
jgi:membrane-associated protease RseP (regulator of RpoE activity)